MPKLKTRKAIAKRVKITGKGKVLRRRAGQSHFNAKESGKLIRKKRRDKVVEGVVAKNIKTDIVAGL